jgi:hypothetical protein
LVDVLNNELAVLEYILMFISHSMHHGYDLMGYDLMGSV